MPALDRRLVLLADRFPDVSRMTLWRIEREPGFPDSRHHSQPQVLRLGRADRVGGVRRRIKRDRAKVDA